MPTPANKTYSNLKNRLARATKKTQKKNVGTLSKENYNEMMRKVYGAVSPPASPPPAANTLTKSNSEVSLVSLGNTVNKRNSQGSLVTLVNTSNLERGQTPNSQGSANTGISWGSFNTSGHKAERDKEEQQKAEKQAQLAAFFARAKQGSPSGKSNTSWMKKNQGGGKRRTKKTKTRRNR